MTRLAESFLFFHCNLDDPSKNAATSVTMHTHCAVTGTLHQSPRLFCRNAVEGGK